MKRLVLCSLLLLLPGGLPAQTAWLPALRDTLDRLQDAGARRRLLQDAARSHPSDAWPHLALALAYGGAAPSDSAPLLRRDPGDQGWKELQRALAADATFAPAAIALAMQALGGSDAERLESARRALMRAGEAQASAALGVALAEVEIRLGDFIAATAAAQSAVGDLASGSAARRLLGIGLMRLPGSAEDGAAEYLAGAAHVGRAAADYFRDAASIASPAELNSWKDAPDDAARAAWIAAFWSRHAAQAGVSAADRLTEHFHRVAVADREYRVRWVPPAAAGAGSGGAPDPNDGAYDDRGLVYVRYGAPDQVEGRGELQSWAYWLPGGRVLRVYFHANRFADGLPLTMRTAPTPHGGLSPGTTPYDAVIDLLQELAPGDEELMQVRQRLMQARQAVQLPRTPWCGRRQCPLTAPIEGPDSSAMAAAAGDLKMYQADLASILRRRALSTLAGEDAHPTVDRTLPFFYDLATFRGREGQTDVVASLAIPGDQLPSFAYPDGRALYAPRVQLALASASSTSFADSAFQRVAPRRLAPGELLRLIIPLSTSPAGLAAYRLGVRAYADSVVGQVYAGSIQLPDYSGTGLKLSDIVLAEGGDGGTWRRGGVSLSFVPTRQFPVHGAVKLFYEIYNLHPGDPYRAEIAIERERGGVWERVQGLFGDAPGRTLVENAVARPDEAGIQQVVQLIHPDLKAGRYRILVTVDNPATGEQASRERRFELSPDR